MEDIIVPDNLPQQLNADFKNLLAFLAREAQAREQQDQICKAHKDGSRGKKDDPQQKYSKQQASREPKSEQTSQVYAVGTSKDRDDKATSKEKTDKCLICESNHFTGRCKKDLPIDQKTAKIDGANACIKCLRTNHKVEECRRVVQCPKCQGEHYAVLCPTKVTKAMATVVHEKDALLPTGHARVSSIANAEVVARFLMDTGAQRTFVTSDLVRKLNIPTQTHEWITVYTFGSKSHAEPKKLPSVSLKINTLDGSTEFRALVPSITGSEPPAVPRSLREKAGLTFAELVDGPMNIEILLSAADVARFLEGSFVKIANYTLMNSILGYVVLGPQRCSGIPSTNSMATLTPKITLEDFWKLEHLGILPRELEKTDETNKLVEIFEASIRRLETGQYETILNVDELKVKTLTSNHSLALRQA